MHLLCDKDCKTEDDYGNYAEKVIYKQRKSIYLKGNRSEWQTNVSTNYSIYLKVPYYCLEVVWSQTS